MARHQSTASTAYSITCASFLKSISHHSRSGESLGWAEKRKIAAIVANGGTSSHAIRTSVLTLPSSAGLDSLGGADSALPLITITSKSRYAIQALAELARQGAVPGGKPIPIAELARRRDIPLQFLEQLFATLRRAGMLQSQRGVKGGYTFVRDPGEVTVLDLVELLDGEIAAEGDSASDPAGVWAAAVVALREVLGGTTVADIVQREADAAGTQMYYI
jgi:Rrf2 family cysteine metabolism transcriptional repressor